MNRSAPKGSPVDAEFRLALEQSRDGRTDLLSQVLETYRPYLLQIANEELDSDLRGKAGGSDLVQQSFMEANRDIANFRGKTEAELTAWLRQILLHNLANLRRQFQAGSKRDVHREVPMNTGASSVVRVGELQTAASSPSSEVAAYEESRTLELAIARLPEDYRQAIELRHRQHRSFAEIGETMARSPEAARKLWARAIEALKAELKATSK